MNSRLMSCLGEGVQLFDGALGTMLFRAGLTQGDSSERWNLDNPHRVREVHRAYVEAGADILITNSFGGSRIKLEEAGLGEQVYEINLKAAQIAREASEDDQLVAGSVGPTGKFMQPLGELSTQDMAEQFRDQIRGLADGGADFICVETMYDVEEALVAARTARELTGLPIAVSMVYDAGRTGIRTMMGLDVPSVVGRLNEEGVDIIGSNCGNGIDTFVEIAAQMRPLTERPILAQANAGVPEIVKGEAVYPEDPVYMAERVEKLLEIGVNIVGGCCGTTPAHTRAFRRVVDAHNSSN